jgi:hypothetical protein
MKDVNNKLVSLPPLSASSDLHDLNKGPFPKTICFYLWVVKVPSPLYTRSFFNGNNHPSMLLQRRQLTKHATTLRRSNSTV